MKSIKELLPQFSITTNNEHQKWKFMLMQKWESIIGNLYSKISIYKIYNNSIILGVSDISWMQELYMLSDLIKNKINTALDKPRIEIVRFQYVAKKNRSIKDNADVSIPEQLPPKKLTSQEQAALDKIHDPELSQALILLLQKCHH